MRCAILSFSVTHMQPRYVATFINPVTRITGNKSSRVAWIAYRSAPGQERSRSAKVSQSDYKKKIDHCRGGGWPPPPCLLGRAAKYHRPYLGPHKPHGPFPNPRHYPRPPDVSHAPPRTSHITHHHPGRSHARGLRATATAGGSGGGGNASARKRAMSVVVVVAALAGGTAVWPLLSSGEEAGSVCDTLPLLPSPGEASERTAV